MSSDPSGTVYGRAPYPPPSGGHYPPSPPPPRRRGLMRVVGFFDSTAKVVGAATALIVAVAGLWAALTQILGGHSSPPGPTSTVDEQVVARQVQACEQAHNMNTAVMVRKLDSGTQYPYSFESCQWPAPSYADRDGYSPIYVELANGIYGASEADGTVWVDRVKGRCATFHLAYDFGKQGGSEHLPAFDATPGQILLGGEGKRYPGPKSDLQFYPGDNEVDIFHNSSYVLVSASCKG